MLQRTAIFSTIFAIAYVSLEAAGLFHVAPPAFHEICYSWPFRSNSLLFLVSAVMLAWRYRARARLTAFILALAVFALVGGLWLSWLTRFSGEIILTEGQMFSGVAQEYAPGSVYRGKLSGFPQVSVTLNKLMPVFRDDGQRLKRLGGKLLFQVVGRKGARELEVASRLPIFADGFMISLKDFGYTPRYAFKMKDGTFLDSAWVYMKLYPPGSEDLFRLITPHTFSVRYSPAPAGSSKPFVLRIARNKDLLFNGGVQLGEDAYFDNGKISFEEVKSWTKIVVTRDKGLYFVWAGLLLGIAGISTGLLQGLGLRKRIN